MKTRQASAARTIACGLVLGSLVFGCDASVEALGSSELGLISIYPNPDECPDAPTDAMTSVDRLGDLTELAACTEVPPGTTCAYDVRGSDGAYNGWSAYVCGCSVEGSWKNIGTAILGYTCPDLAPTAGGACSDPLPGPCPYYPDQQVYCVDGAWKYETSPRYPCSELGIILP